MSEKKTEKHPEDQRVEAIKVIDQVLETRMAARDRKFEEEIRALAEPREDRRIPVTAEPEVTEGDGEQQERQQVERRPYGSSVTRLATHPLYRELPEMEQRVRTPESDHYIQCWAIAMTHRDMPKVREYFDKLENLARQWEIGVPNTVGVEPYTGSAGAAVPYPLLQLVMINRDRVAKIPPLSTAIQLTGSSHRIPRMDQATVAMVAEGSTATETEPTLDEKAMTSRKMQGRAAISDEALNDSAFNLASLLGTRMGTAMGQFEDVQACQTGGAPEISEAINQGLTPTAIGGALSYDDVATLYFAVAQPYRPNAVFYANEAGALALTKVRDSANFPIFSQQNARPGAIVDDSADGFVFRKPVYEVPLVSSLTTNGDGDIVFMDPSVYGWGRRQGMVARVTDAVQWAADRWSFKFTQRVDGLVLDEGGAGNASRAEIHNFS